MTYYHQKNQTNHRYHENKFPQVERFRTEPPDEIIQRFRRDAHEVIDIFIDVVGTTMKSMPNVPEMAAGGAGNVVVKPVQMSADLLPIVAAGKNRQSWGESTD